MGRIKFLILLSVFSINLNAANVLDVYGADIRISEDLIKNYGSQISELETQHLKELIKISNGGNDHYIKNVMIPKKTQLVKKIQKQYGFAYVQFNTVTYPDNKNKYTTIEVVSQNDKERLQFIPIKNTTDYTAKLKPDLVDKMVTFNDSAMMMFLKKQLNKKEPECPVYHCLFGFNHPKLKDSFKLFIQSVSKEKELLIKTMNNDPSPERRTAAIFLLGFLNDPHEIISLLTKHVMDSDDGVRNSAMRVIGTTMYKAKIYNIDVLPFLNLLDSPFDTDRNKSLLVLLSAANVTSSKELIIREGKKQLVSLLRLKQPNNHDMAYALLKKISGKDFGSHNVGAWEKWLDTRHKRII